ncbi:hypothetical protein QQ054_32095 [Oscillatoria amoena NRMC-F 0135]|nr:hypothetical protein [Oscillatoria amoena NRMC-F 0135]
MNDKEKKARLKELEALSPAEVANLAVEAEANLAAALAEKSESENSLNSGLAETQRHLDAANKLSDELSEKLETEKKARLDAEKQRDDANEIVAELNKELEAVRKEKAKDPNAAPEIEYGGNTYTVVIPRVTHKGKVVTAKELEESPELVQELLYMKSGMLQLKNKED